MIKQDYKNLKLQPEPTFKQSVIMLTFAILLMYASNYWS